MSDVENKARKFWDELPMNIAPRYYDDLSEWQKQAIVHAYYLIHGVAMECSDD